MNPPIGSLWITNYAVPTFLIVCKESESLSGTIHVLWSSGRTDLIDSGWFKDPFLTRLDDPK